MDGIESAWEMVRDGDVEGISRLLDRGMDPADPEECWVSVRVGGASNKIHG